MQTGSMSPSASCGRLHREKEYWDQVYARQGAGARNFSWMRFIEDRTYSAEFFQELLKPLTGRRWLSLGGGIDHLGVSLAQEGRHVVCVDISPVASARTRELAEHASVAGRLTALAGGCEEMSFPEGAFDVVVCKRALHHMEVGRVLANIHRWLTPGGVFLAEEPVCLHPLVQWVHARFPFYGSAPHTADERELVESDLALIQRTFRETRFDHFDFLARESLAYLFRTLRLHRTLKLLGKWDWYLVNRLFPPLRRLSNYVVIRGVK